MEEVLLEFCKQYLEVEVFEKEGREALQLLVDKQAAAAGWASYWVCCREYKYWEIGAKDYWDLQNYAGLWIPAKLLVLLKFRHFKPNESRANCVPEKNLRVSRET